MGNLKVMYMQCCQLWRSKTLGELVKLQRSGLLQRGNGGTLGHLVTVKGKRNNKKGRLIPSKLIFLQSLFHKFIGESNAVHTFYNEVENVFPFMR